MVKQPYLTIVIAVRNDNHGGNMIPRFNSMLTNLDGQIEKYHLPTELILVEWNPPKDTRPIREVVTLPASLYCLNTHFIVKHGHGFDIPKAVNYGIRRAKGVFILPSTIDLLYSDKLMEFISERKLDKDARYRATRYDVSSQGEIVNICTTTHNKIDTLPALHTNACGDFQLMSWWNWHLLNGYYEGNSHGMHTDGLLSYASYAAGIKEVILPFPIYHIEHNRKPVSRLLRELRYWRYRTICHQMIQGKRSFILNGNDWGFI